jgi:hypothetical protein
MKNLAIDLTPISKVSRLSLPMDIGADLKPRFDDHICGDSRSKLRSSPTPTWPSASADLVELVPLIVFGLYGGVLADAVDRKKMIWLTEAAAGILSLILLPQRTYRRIRSSIIIYIVGAAFAAVNGLHGPSADAILPRVVAHKDIPQRRLH